MYFEVWVDLDKKEEVLERLLDICEEVHEVFYDYQFIVRVNDEKLLEIEGVRRVRRHYNC